MADYLKLTVQLVMPKLFAVFAFEFIANRSVSIYKYVDEDDKHCTKEGKVWSGHSATKPICLRGGRSLFVSNSDNRAMRQPGKTSLDVKSQYRLTWLLRQLRDAKASLGSSHLQSVLRLLKYPPKSGKIELSSAFFSKFLHRTSEVSCKKWLKITFCIYVSKRVAFSRNWWDNFSKIVLMDFSPLAVCWVATSKS